MSENPEKARHDCYLFIERTLDSSSMEKIVIQGTGETPEAARELFDHSLKNYVEEFKHRKVQ